MIYTLSGRSWCKQKASMGKGKSSQQRRGEQQTDVLWQKYSLENSETENSFGFLKTTK